MAVAFIWAGHAHKQWAASAAGANGMDKAGAALDRTEAGAGLLSKASNNLLGRASISH